MYKGICLVSVYFVLGGCVGVNRLSCVVV